MHRSVDGKGIQAVMTEVFGEPGRCRRTVRKQGNGGAGTRNESGDGPARFTKPKGIAQSRRQLNGGTLEIVDQDAAQGVRVAASQRLQDLRVDGGGFLGGHAFGESRSLSRVRKTSGVESP